MSHSAPFARSHFRSGSADPVADRDAFRARCGAWERQRQFDTAYGFGIFLLDGTFAR